MNRHNFIFSFVFTIILFLTFYSVLLVFEMPKFYLLSTLLVLCFAIMLLGYYFSRETKEENVNTEDGIPNDELNLYAKKDVFSQQCSSTNELVHMLNESLTAAQSLGSDFQDHQVRYSFG